MLSGLSLVQTYNLRFNDEAYVVLRRPVSLENPARRRTVSIETDCGDVGSPKRYRIRDERYEMTLQLDISGQLAFVGRKLVKQPVNLPLRYGVGRKRTGLKQQ